MYLKSIEVHGFKSFANKIVFEFKDGITGIVGPNGSGKSNVADAVRWVLGEQSAKQLRGSNMQDVIFSGTENRKAMGYAYVAITLDNSDHSLPIDYEEVTVARRVYRSGESEYLINGTNCRLKDVTSLFFDTGIGKEGYSIIGQGQIDKILSGKPEDRRELFDEAVGIVKFKKNKAATEKSLEQEHQNLLRVQDILDQLELQVGPLKKQSEVAKQYLEYRDQQKILDVNVFLLESDRIKDLEKEYDEKIAIVNGDLESTQKAYDKTKQEYVELEAEIEARDLTIDHLRTDISELRLGKEKLEGEINVIQEQIHAAHSEELHQKEQLTRIQTALKEKEAERQTYDKQQQQLAIEQSETEGSLIEWQKRLDANNSTMLNAQKGIEEAKSNIISFMNESAEITGRLQRYDTLLEQISLRKTELNQRLLVYQSSEKEQSDIVEKMTLEKTESDAAVAQLEAETQATESELVSNLQLLHKTQEDLAKAEEQFHTSRTKLDTVRNMTERYEGYGNSIRRVMEQKSTHTGVKGVVADLIKTEKTYEAAIETALGGNIQNIVTDNETTAKQMIEYLKQNKFGRATFLPLTGISGGQALKNPQVLKEQGVIGRASSLVDTEDEYQPVVDYLLGRIVVVDNIDHAIVLARKYKHSMHMVTLEGEYLSPGGAMTGGTFKNNSNLLGRRREMEDLTQLVKVLKEKIETLRKNEVQIRQRREVLKVQAEDQNAKRQELYLKRNTIIMNLEQAEEQIANLTKNLAELQRENRDLEKQVADIHSGKDELAANSQIQSEAKEECEKKIQELESVLNEVKKDKEQAEEHCRQLLLDANSLAQRSQFLKQNILRIKTEREALEAELTAFYETAEKTSGNAHELVDKMDQLREMIQKKDQDIVFKTQQLEQKNREKEASAREHKEFFAKREELNERLSMLDKEQYRLTGQIERIQEQIQTLENYMWEEYELTYQRALELRDDEHAHLPTLKKELASIRSKIKGLGNVNVNAIEDYKVISEKYEFLSAQRDDIVKAEDNLKKILKTLEVEMRKQFKENFAEIQIMFDKVFKELFGGGKASLELVDEDDLIETGILINAQPPGKKLQNMMQLSGGEKALTAIAILFAIQSLKPSPFCLLDEIEAALDESNVGRFAEYLHKLTKDTQFIVITHRRGTMTAADILYGITMQEKGVSTLVSVNLIENDLDK